MKLKIGMVTARFNVKVTEELEIGALDYLDSLAEKIELEVFAVRVPGAIEIPLAVQGLIEQGCHGVVALGCIIRGETAHFEQVCNSVERNLSHLMMTTKTPIGFGILTVENMQQAKERIGGKHGHKGEEAAEAVVEMVTLLNQLKTGEGFISERPEELGMHEPKSAKAKNKAVPKSKAKKNKKVLVR